MNKIILKKERNEAEKLVRWPSQTQLIHSRGDGTWTQVWLQTSFFSYLLHCLLTLHQLFVEGHPLFHSWNIQPLNLCWLDVKTILLWLTRPLTHAVFFLCLLSLLAVSPLPLLVIPCEGFLLYTLCITDYSGQRVLQMCWRQCELKLARCIFFP